MYETLGKIREDTEAMIGASAGKTMVQKMAYFFRGKDVELELWVQRA